jgi:phage protein U
MIGVMMQLGTFKFSLSTAAYDVFTRSTNYRWQGQERFGKIPAQQYTGPGEETITLSGIVYPSFAGGTGQLNSMRAVANTGKPLQLVDGQGYVWGKWIINSIEEAREIFFDNGISRKQGFTMKITQYGDDQ